ncbi:GNAT family N-acetyltransferase [Thauera linaloolentis]|uniref:GCN5-like N-acetyltransferase n=1 Tax=Thauera linaloolentis (strain DSM 12138 / JCM 21573 / CCUG 41526 / CIP 105981 / IAM 15112 / NBRC 102519 / 47Lol) TaxID=1123367 RepID=N6YDF9_THAL4|nr:GNAT family N-acetyltransferase [Thauera linaloolentis]ENO89575.1 GCN5-like N-acetyltransferase [Thauera linaloolentis 47Lol = DSM 12138]MCM8565893.1 GNAT family N-acetyltransferase [Thauera linaloolentis]
MKDGSCAGAGLDPRIEIADWQAAQARVMPLRMRVFVVEQGVPADIELDEFDPCSRHAIATDADGEVIATGRLLPDGHIGRMAVDAGWRGRGVGGAVLEALAAEAAAHGMPKVMLNAQLRALGFYRRHGFAEYGEAFMEAGIPHRAMQRAAAHRAGVADE